MYLEPGIVPYVVYDQWLLVLLSLLPLHLQAPGLYLFHTEISS